MKTPFPTTGLVEQQVTFLKNCHSSRSRHLMRFAKRRDRRTIRQGWRKEDRAILSQVD